MKETKESKPYLKDRHAMELWRLYKAVEQGASTKENKFIRHLVWVRTKPLGEYD